MRAVCTSSSAALSEHRTRLADERPCVDFGDFVRASVQAATPDGAQLVVRCSCNCCRCSCRWWWRRRRRRWWWWWRRWRWRCGGGRQFLRERPRCPRREMPLFFSFWSLFARCIDLRNGQVAKHACNRGAMWRYVVVVVAAAAVVVAAAADVVVVVVFVVVVVVVLLWLFCVCVRACVRVCVCACVRACVWVCLLLLLLLLLSSLLRVFRFFFVGLTVSRQTRPRRVARKTRMG